MLELVSHVVEKATQARRQALSAEVIVEKSKIGAQ
jgi:hypothetical protein